MRERVTERGQARGSSGATARWWGSFPSARGVFLKGAKCSLCMASNHKIFLLPFLSVCFLNTLDKNSGRQNCSWKDATLQKLKRSCQYYNTTGVRKWDKRGLCLYSLLIVSKSLLTRVYGGNSTSKLTSILSLGWATTITTWEERNKGSQTKLQPLSVVSAVKWSLII